MTTPIYPGARCTCAAGRYIRFVIPAVPGVKPVISCRDAETTGPQSLREHPIPPDTEILIHVPGVDTEVAS